MSSWRKPVRRPGNKFKVSKPKDRNSRSHRHHHQHPTINNKENSGDDDICNCDKCVAKRNLDITHPPREDLASDKLGGGTFGRVYINKNDSNKAIKYILTQRSNETPLMECAIMRCITHPHIVKSHNNYSDLQGIYLDMDRAYMDLRKYVKDNNRPIPREDALRWLAQILSALKYLHSINIIHADIKINNILLYPIDPHSEPPYEPHQLNVKLVDFGKARYIRSRFNTHATPKNISPPEYLHDMNTWSKMPNAWTLDIWTLAATWVKVFYNKNLYPNHMLKSIEEVRKCINDIENKTQVGRIIHKMLILEANKRPSAEKVLKFEELEPYATGVEGLIYHAPQAELSPEEWRSINQIPNTDRDDIPILWIGLIAERFKYVRSDLPWVKILRYSIMTVYELKFDAMGLQDNFRKLPPQDREEYFQLLESIQYSLLQI